MVNTRQLCIALRVTPKQVKGWREAGMPFEPSGRHFAYDPAAVERWLIDTDRAGSNESSRILTTVKAVCSRYHVDPRTVRDWHNAPHFPGRPGHYPVELIDYWLKLRSSLTSGDNGDERKLTKLRMEKQELELERLRGEHIKLSVAVSWIARIASESSAILDELPAKLIAKLTSTLEPDQLKEVADVAATTIEQVKASLRTLPEYIASGKEA